MGYSCGSTGVVRPAVIVFVEVRSSAKSGYMSVSVGVLVQLEETSASRSILVAVSVSCSSLFGCWMLPIFFWHVACLHARHASGVAGTGWYHLSLVWFVAAEQRPQTRGVLFGDDPDDNRSESEADCTGKI